MLNKNKIHIGVVGASGKVGKELVKLITQIPSELYCTGFVSENSTALSTDATSTNHRVLAISDPELLRCDVIIDFSTAESTMELLNIISDCPIPLVVGTTGFSEQNQHMLNEEGNKRPCLVGANFTLGFEAFLSSALTMLNSLPESQVTVAEVYNQHKKPVASGTTQRLVNTFLTVVDGNGNEREINQDIQRIGDTAGVNTVRLELGFATYEMTLTVHSRQAYAAGALKAARWLIDQPYGSYVPKDMLKQTN